MTFRVVPAQPGDLHVAILAYGAGVNLAADFEVNPFSDAFAKVDNAVFTKQNYETIQIKSLFYTPAAKADPDGIAALTDKVREPLVDAIGKSFVPVTHTIKIEPQ